MKALNSATKFWFIITLIGQWLFAAYVGIYHGSKLFINGVQGMRETHMANGYIEGDTAGNAILAIHLIIAIVIVGGGPLQLIPRIRSNFPKFHRWLGRCYLVFVFFAAAGGLYLIWTRPIPSFSNIYQSIAITIEAILIIVFSIMTVRYAIGRKIKTHQKWALRLFVVASGVWFLRIGYNAWFFIEALLGFHWEHFFDFWSFGSFILPLSMVELYLRTKKKPSMIPLTAGLLFIATVFMALGVFLATQNMWLPRIINLVSN